MSAIDRGALLGKLDKLLPLIEEMDKDWSPDWTDHRQEKFYICMHECGMFYIDSDRVNRRIVGLCYMQEKTAKHILNLLSKQG